MLDVSEGVEVLRLLVPIHAFGGEYADGNLLPEEVGDDGPGDLGVEELLLAGVELVLLGVRGDQLLQSLLVDIVIHLAPDHALIEVESFNAPPFFRFLLPQKLLNDFERFSLLLYE